MQIVPWGFDPAEIGQRVTLWHAEGDTMVPYAGAREMADILKDVALRTADPTLFRETDSDMDVHTGSISHGFLRLLGELRG